MSNRVKKYIAALNYADKILIVLSDASSGVSLNLFTTLIGTLFGIASASISLVFFISNGIVKTFLKTMEKKKINTEKLFYSQE